jgi:hypothetical protein
MNIQQVLRQVLNFHQGDMVDTELAVDEVTHNSSTAMLVKATRMSWSPRCVGGGGIGLKEHKKTQSQT